MRDAWVCNAAGMHALLRIEQHAFLMNAMRLSLTVASPLSFPPSSVEFLFRDSLHSNRGYYSLFVYRPTCPAVIHQWGHAQGRRSMAQVVPGAMPSHI